MKSAPVVCTVRVGSLRLDVRKYADGRHGFDYSPPGENRVKVRVHDRGEAEERAREILGAARGGKVERLAIDEAEYAEFLRWKAERAKGAKIPELVSALLAAKARKGVSAKYYRDLQDLEAFAKHFTGNIRDLTSAQVVAWLDARKVGPRRWNNLRAAIISLHSYARRERLLPAEKTPVELIEKRATSVEVHTYTPKQLECLLRAVPDAWMPVIALGAFCGLRPEEVAPDARTKKVGLLWENILWSKGKIDVPARVAKDRRRRFAPLTPAAAAFLIDRKNDRGPIAPDARLSNQTWLRKCGVQWIKDGLRHSFASYRLALTKDTPALALEMGNSVAIIFQHYLDLKHEEEAREWFALRPESAKSSIPTHPETLFEC